MEVEGRGIHDRIKKFKPVLNISPIQCTCHVLINIQVPLFLMLEVDTIKRFLPPAAEKEEEEE